MAQAKDINWTELRLQAIGNDARSVLPPNIKLPMLSATVSEFLQASNSAEVEVTKLAQIVERDSGISCELLRYVNSSLLGLRQKAHTARQALTMLGIRQARLFLMTQGVKTALNAKDSKLVNLKTFWGSSLERALVAREVAGLMRADMDLAFAGAMLADAVLPMLTNEMLDIYQSYLQLPENTTTELAAHESRKLGYDHAFVTAQIMCGWKFPDDLVVCVAGHHRGLELLTDPVLGQSAAAAVGIACLVPDSLRQSRQGMAQLQHLEQIWPKFRLRAVADRVADQFAELVPGTTLEFSLKRRVDLLEAAQKDSALVELAS